MTTELLKNKFPELLSEWDYHKNESIGVNIDSLSHGSKKKCHWICKNNHKFESTPNARTKTGKINQCRVCYYDSIRIHGKEDLLMHKKRENKILINTTYIGDKNESFIVDLLNQSNHFKTVKKIGNFGCNSDIIITSNDNSVNYIQIKTLTKNKKPESFYMTNNHVYPDNMLIVMVDNSHSYFAIDFYKNISHVKRLALQFGYNDSIYKNIMYKDVNHFLDKIKELVRLSCDKLGFSDTIGKEMFMMSRFEKYCKTNNILFERNETNGNAVDGTINGYTFQAKFVSNISGNRCTYQVSTQKSCGRLNGKRVRQNYEIGDFDYLVVEVGGTNKDKYKYIGNFCIIPERDLAEQNMFKTSTCNGKKSVYICPPDYLKPHWSIEFWNKIPDKFQSTELQIIVI